MSQRQQRRLHALSAPPPAPTPSVSTTPTTDPALVARREQAEAKLRALLAKFEAAGITPNSGHVVAQAMGMLVARLVAGGFVQEDEAKAELAEYEHRILTPLYARALQEKEEQALSGRKPKRSDTAQSDPAAFTSPTLLRRERLFKPRQGKR